MPSKNNVLPGISPRALSKRGEHASLLSRGETERAAQAHAEFVWIRLQDAAEATVLAAPEVADHQVDAIHAILDTSTRVERTTAPRKDDSRVEQRRELRTIQAEEYIGNVIRQWPPLSQRQKDRIRAVLDAGPGDVA